MIGYRFSADYGDGASARQREFTLAVGYADNRRWAAVNAR